MRMWMVDTRILCRKHLLGEHVENHMFVGSMKKCDLDGYVDNNLLELTALPDRHEELVREMLARGYNHQSPFDMETYEANFPQYGKYAQMSEVHVEKALNDLLSRCTECQARYENLENL